MRSETIFMGFRKGREWMVHGLDNDSLCFSCARLKTLITISPFYLSAIFNLYKFVPNVRYIKKLKSYYFLDQKSPRIVQITFIIMIFQIIPIVKVRASNYLARFVRLQAYQI